MKIFSIGIMYNILISISDKKVIKLYPKFNHYNVGMHISDFVRCIIKMVSFWSSIACFFYLTIFTVFTPNQRFLASFEVGISLPVSKRVQLDLNQCAHLLVNWVNGSTNRVLDELERDQKKENHLNIISKMMGT